jgi:DNA-binding HxlR family transcriptional regulator
MSEAIKKSKAILAAKDTLEIAKSFIKRNVHSEQPKTVLTKKQTPKPPKPSKPVRYERVIVEQPRESKLIVCLNILCTLVSTGPLTISQLKISLKLDEARLSPLLKLLWNRGFVEEEPLTPTESRYRVTERGTKMLKVVSPIIREAQKMRIRDLEAVTNALFAAGYH